MPKKIFNLLLPRYDFNFNIVNTKGEFIVHKNSKYNWSKYFYPDITLQNTFPKDFSYILKENVYISQTLISKKVYIDQKNHIIFILEFNKSALESTLDEYGNSIYVILSLTLLLSVFLAVIFSNPIANLNKKLEDEKHNLNLSALKNSERLDDSLALIDKYVMYIKLDKNCSILDVSSSFCYVSGFDKAELVGEEYTKLLHPDFDIETFYDIWKRLTSGKKWHGEIKNLKKHGGHYWVDSFFEPNFDEQNNVISITEIRNNITDKKIIQNLYDDINYQIEQLNAVFQSADSGIVLLDEKGNFKKVNVAFCKLLAYSNDALLKQNLLEMVLPLRKQFLEKIFEEAKEFGSISNIETVFLCKNNDDVHVNLSLRMLPDKKHIVMVANSLEDKRKLQELNLNLEQRVHKEVEKNIEKDRIHQEERIQNVKLTSIGALAAGITHEINTPLTYLKGNFEMMQYDIDALPQSDEKRNMQEDSERITDAINRIANIVESMREMSQSSTEAKENINLYSTIITSLTMAYNMSKQISRIYLNGKLFTLNRLDKNEYTFLSTVQKQRIEQVWIIIINNAMDELKKVDDYEDRLLEIKIAKENAQVVIGFQDNAGGISSDILSQIFEPFMSTKEHGGMGIGLNIAKKIIEEQNGEIRAFNENDGALFEVRLPLIENDV
jgi:PAS domain S-box-containing protein